MVACVWTGDGFLIFLILGPGLGFGFENFGTGAYSENVTSAISGISLAERGIVTLLCQGGQFNSLWLTQGDAAL